MLPEAQLQSLRQRYSSRKIPPDHFEGLGGVKVTLWNANHGHPPLSQEGILALITGWVTVPVSTINLNGQIACRHVEVNGVAPDPYLSLVVKSQGRKRLAYDSLNAGLCVAPHVAGKRTVGVVGIARQASKLVAAGGTLDHDRRTTAFLRAVVPVKPLLRPKHLATTLARDILSFCNATLVTTYRVAVGHRSIDDECLVTDGTHLAHLGRVGDPTCRRAVFLPALDSTQCAKDLLTATFAGKQRTRYAGGVVAVCAAIQHATTLCREEFAAVLADSRCTRMIGSVRTGVRAVAGFGTEALELLAALEARMPSHCRTLLVGVAWCFSRGLRHQGSQLSAGDQPALALSDYSM